MTMMVERPDGKGKNSDIFFVFSFFLFPPQPSTSDISTLVIFLAQKYHNKKPLILKKSKQIILKKCKLQSQLSKRFSNYFLRIIIF